MRRVTRWAFPLLALIGSTVAVATALTPVAAGDTFTGRFVIGDVNGVEGADVTLWGAQWWKLNDISGPDGPASFKGYALTIDAVNCTFTSRPGDSPPPPDPPLDGLIPVLVTAKVWKEGPVIKGTIKAFGTVAIDPGYDDNPGHEGTGTVTDLNSCTVGGSGEL